MQPEVTGHNVAVTILLCIFLFSFCIIRKRTTVPEMEKTVDKSGKIFGIYLVRERTTGTHACMVHSGLGGDDRLSLKACVL